jgi:hypothetical protein
MAGVEPPALRLFRIVTTDNRHSQVRIALGGQFLGGASRDTSANTLPATPPEIPARHDPSISAIGGRSGRWLAGRWLHKYVNFLDHVGPIFTTDQGEMRAPSRR